MITDVFAVFLLIGLFAFLVLLRIPIVFSVGVATVVTTLYLGLPLQIVAQHMVKGVNVFSLMAVPFFILAGEIMGTGGISTRLIKLSNALIGWLRGGLAMVNILASTFFGGISGSSAADTSSIGSLLIPMMVEEGYDADFATTVTMASSVQSILIPPSHNMVIYSLAAGGVSIGKLFLGGLVPGVFLGFALMVYSYIISVRKKYPVGEKFRLKTALSALREAGLGLATVLIVVVGVVSGIFTATESASIAVVYALIITFFIYREVPLSELSGILGRSIKTLSIVMMLIGTSSAFGWLLAYLKVPALIAQAILGFSENKYVVLVIVNIILIILGMIMDMSSIILITTPILYPIVTRVGVDPVHFGVIMMLNLGIGLLTPPVGGTLFLGSAISGIKIEELTRSMLPFYTVMLIVLIAITYLPIITMFLPTKLMP